MRYPTIVALDVDGIIFNSSPLTKIACNGYISKILTQLPTLKKAALEIIEAGELLLGARYEMNDRMNIVCNWGIPYMGIITDRSLRGLLTALGEDFIFILKMMKFIQTRKPILSNSDKLRRWLKSGAPQLQLWETPSVKPEESVLYNLVEFAKCKNVPHNDILLMDDDREFRFIAKSRFGFMV